MRKKIYIAADHAGVDLKNEIVKLLKDQFEVKDFGPFSKDSVDYPDFAHKVCHQLNEIYAKDSDFTELQDVGVLICGSGQGMNIAANKYKNLRSALCYQDEIAKMARAHNNAQVICLGARFTNLQEALKMIETFATTSFEGGRHKNRVNKIGQCQ